MHPAPEAAGQRRRLAATTGVFTVMASAVAQEYGGGINFVLVRSVGQYPEAGALIPVAMVVAGLVLLPKITMLGRFAQVMPRAGSMYVWLTRSVWPPLGFGISFLSFVGITAAIGFLALTVTTFLQGVFTQFGIAAPWLVSNTGQLVVGLLLIWAVFVLHYSGIRNYGRVVGALFGLVLLAALSTVVVGFGTPPETFVEQVEQTVGAPVAPQAPGETGLGSFLGVVTLFMFVYGGQLGATSLGGEARQATRSLPRGIWLGWAAALVLYSLIAFALFHLAPVGAVQALLETGNAEFATTPGVTSLVVPRAAGIALNGVVIVLIATTLAPQMLDSSRYLFAWAQDGLLPRSWLRTNRFHAPDVALLATAVLASIFLVEGVYFGFEIGVLLRSSTIVLVFGTLGVGVLNLRLHSRFRDVAWARSLTSHPDAMVAGVLAIVLAAVLFSSVIVVQGNPLLLQPSVQALIALLLAAVIYLCAHRRAARRGESLTARLREPPAE